MNRYLLKTGIPLIIYVMTTILSLSGTCKAQSEEEMEILRMFYKDKDLVVSPTRHPKQISHVAENISVITAEEIEAMNAHTVAEALNTIPGLLVSSNRDFGAASLINIQSSQKSQILVLIDEIPWNPLSEGIAETSSIPVGIIKRIEIIKGPASSAWGSPLGGVINIITKPAGKDKEPAGSISASYGKSASQDYRAEISGMAGPVGYYFYATKQDSDGLIVSRSFDNSGFYSKFKIPVSDDMILDLTMGYSAPRIGHGDYPIADITSSGLNRAFFTTTSLKASLNRLLSLNLSIYSIRHKYTQENDILGLGHIGIQGDRYLDLVLDEENTGVRSQVVLCHGTHTAVFGADVEEGKLDQTIYSGAFLQTLGSPESSMTFPEVDKWALYANDTVVIGRWSITPGIRYDHNSITGSFISPSLGVTYKLGNYTILRVSAARGFTIPPLSWSLGGGLFLDPNPSLEQEEIRSFQLGVESLVSSYVWVKTTLFYQNVENALSRILFEGGPPTYNDIYINAGKIRRQGLEIETETIPIYNFSFLIGFFYIDLAPPNEKGASEVYSYDIGIRYDDKNSFSALLSGCYVWRDLPDFYRAKYDDFIWDLNLNKQIRYGGETDARLFFTVHNIFNGNHYTYVDNKIPGRWLEGGIKFRF